MLKNPFGHPSVPLSLFPSMASGEVLARKGEILYLRDTLRLPALRQAQDMRRGFAPLHTPFFISRLVPPAQKWYLGVSPRPSQGVFAPS